MGRWADRAYKAGVIVACYVVVSELKSLYDSWRWARLRRLREELERKMRLEPREAWKKEELAAYDGNDPEKPILVGIDGRVFNVWRSRHLYGGNGAYQALTGRDATRLLAKGILDDSEDDGEPLTADELDAMRNWKEYFGEKYDDVGPLVPA
eukprot:TRINITY_DN14150_c0_g2_i5.p1 TRINITY_DN14150_c0_g2~~TRINITY_DN14150_c0_g2_i5.p1  ORF type:complete len:152 (-),score=32.48 TRINITY_DN14150_c0_g2_i5:184-639(-)